MDPAITNIKFSYANAVPVKQAIERFSDISFPNLRTRIINNKVTNPVMVVMAKNDEEIVGLAIAARQRKSTSEILTLMVKKDYRKIGIGTKLVKQMNKLQAEHGHKESRIFFFQHWENNDFLKKLCERYMWSKPKTMLRRFEHDFTKSREKILPSGLKLPNGYSFKNWDKLDVKVKNEHYKTIDAREDVKNMFKIGNYVKRLAPELTHVLYKGDDIIGWCLAMKANKNSIEHTLFILPEHRTSPILPIALISKNWLTQMRSRYTIAVWLIDSKNGAMLRFMKKKLPHLVDFETSLSFIAKDISAL